MNNRLSDTQISGTYGYQGVEPGLPAQLPKNNEGKEIRAIPDTIPKTALSDDHQSPAKPLSEMTIKTSELNPKPSMKDNAENEDKATSEAGQQAPPPSSQSYYFNAATSSCLSPGQPQALIEIDDLFPVGIGHEYNQWAESQMNNKSKMPLDTLKILRRYIDEPDITKLANCTFRYIATYLETGDKPRRLRLACIDFGYTLDELTMFRQQNKSPADLAHEIVER